MSQFKTRGEAAEILGVHYHTLYAMAKRGEIETIKVGNRQMYSVDKYIRKQGIKESINRVKICYCRVSSNKQKEDLKRQEDSMKTKFPNYTLISDIGSGMNNNRPGYRKIIDHIVKGELEILVVSYKDRLTRFNFDLLKWMMEEYSNGDIVVMNKKEEQTPHEEISQDILAIMNVYVAKINGLRKYKKMIKDEISHK